MRLPVVAILLSILAAPFPSAAQPPEPDRKPPLDSPTAAPPAPTPQNTPDQQRVPQFERPVSWKLLVPNTASDQKKIWLFPRKLGQRRIWIPAAVILGSAAGLVALDHLDEPYFRRTSFFQGFNRVVTGNTAVGGTIALPVSLYVAGLARKDSKMTGTALLAGEAVADAEILTTVLKDITKRERPISVPLQGNFSDTFFDNQGSVIRGNGSFPSGHTIAAFAVATIISRRYGNHRWVPYVAYGLAGVVAFSRLTLSAHFASDIFVGGALGYSISRFAVLQQ